MRRHYGCTQTQGLVQTATFALAAALAGLSSTIAVAQPTVPEPAPAPTMEPAPLTTPEAVVPQAAPAPQDQNPFEAAPVVPPPPPPAPTTSPIPDGGIPPAPVPPQFPPAIPSLDYGVRFRIGGQFQNPDRIKSMDKFALTVNNLDIYFGGQLHRMLKWQAGVTASVMPGASGATPSGVAVGLLDVIGKFEPIPEFSIWVGRMIVMADRWVPSGPWGMDEWFYPGVYPGFAAPALPKGGTNVTGIAANARDNGVTIWGSIAGGHFKYFAGAYGLQDPRVPPLWSGRLQLSLLSPEPGFYHRTTYYGTKDLLAIGLGAQLQSEGSVGPATPATMMMAAIPGKTDTYKEFNADLVLDKNLGDSGTISVNGGMNMFGGEYRYWKYSTMASLGYLFPGVVGIGKLRPSVRLQMGELNQAGAKMSQVIDVQLGYVIMGWWARFAVGYRYSSTSVAPGGKEQKIKGNMIFLGLTIADP